MEVSDSVSRSSGYLLVVSSLINCDKKAAMALVDTGTGTSHLDQMRQSTDEIRY